MKVILLFGLSGSGKTTLAKDLLSLLPNSYHINGDDVRKQANDWDFSLDGRIRQAFRIKDKLNSITADFVVIDFIAPLELMRTIIDADFLVWVDTVDSSIFKDTDSLFEIPDIYDLHIVGQKDSKASANLIINKIDNTRSIFNDKLPTVQMLGRWQPWHAGHRALFIRAISKTGQVCIMVRDCSGIDNSNPFEFKTVKWAITRDLDAAYLGQYKIVLVPNITNITYGRNVGYSIEEEVFSQAIHDISATSIRKELGIERV